MLAGKKRSRSPSADSGYNTEDQMIQELGYGKSLYKDEEDEMHIMSLKEMERERILNERHQKMLAVQEKVKLLKEFKQQNRGTTQIEGKRDALDDLKERRDKRLVKKHSMSQDEHSEEQSEAIKEESGEEYSSNEEVEDGQEIERESVRKDIGITDLERIRVSRQDLEKWHTELYFEDVIKGSFVKVNMGEAKQQGKSGYKIFQILKVREGKKYKFGDVMVDKELLGKHGKDTKAFQMAVVSNSQFTAQEYSEWRNSFDNHSKPFPSLDEIEEIELQLNKIKNHSYTPQEINKIIEQNINQLIDKGSSDINVTYIRTQIETQINIAKKTIADAPSPEAREILSKLEQSLDKINEIKRKKIEEQKNYANSISFNKRAQKLQIEEDRKRSEMIKKKTKNKEGFDVFSTLQCRPSILWNTNNDAEKMAQGQADINKEVELMNAREEGSNMSAGGVKRKAKTEYKTDFEKSVARKEKIIQTMKSIDLGLDDLISNDPNDFSKYPPLNKMPKLVELNPILKAKLAEKELAEAKNETRKIYTLDEY